MSKHLSSILYDVHTTKLPNDHFSESVPDVKQCMNMFILKMLTFIERVIIFFFGTRKSCNSSKCLSFHITTATLTGIINHGPAQVTGELWAPPEAARLAAF